MKQKTDLFELIHSLDKNERRYFKLYSAMQKGNKNYLKLFEAIEKQKVYDENKLREKYRNEKFIKQLGFVKNYLYKLIMKSLTSYHNENLVDSRIQNLILQSKILYRKALYKQYFRTMAEAKQMANKYERFGYYLHILDTEKIISPKAEIQTVKSEGVYNEAILVLEKLRNTFEFSRLASLMQNNYRSYGTSRNKQHEEDINRILSSALMTSDDNALSSRARELYYWILEINHKIRADHDKMLSALKYRHKIVNGDPGPFEDYLINYSSDILHSLIDTLLLAGRLDEAGRYLEESSIKSKHKTEADRIDNDILKLFVTFRIHLKKGELKQASLMIPALENALRLYDNKLLIDTELSIRFYIVKCRIMEKNFKAALSSANSLIDHPLLSKRADYESYIKILYLLIHFELGNYSLLRYLIISTYRYLYKKEKLYKLEKLILEFIRKLPDVKNELDLNYMFEMMGRQLLLLKKDKYEKNAFEYFDFLSWVQERG